MEHYISINREEFRKSGKLGIKCTCGEVVMTKNNETSEVFQIVREHMDKTGHRLSIHASPLVD